MEELLFEETASSEATAPPENAALRFCTACGRPLAPAPAICENCRPRPARALEAAHPGEGRAVALALGLYGVILLVCVACAIIGHFNDDPAYTMLVCDAAMSVVVLIWTLAAARRMELGWRRPASLLTLPAAAGCAALTFALAYSVIGALHSWLGVPEVRLTDDLREAGFGAALIVLMICVQPAVIEELAFRGVILGSLRKPLGTAQALVVSSALFAILHLSVPSLPHLFVLGLAAGVLRIATGSLYPAMVLHFTHNLFCVITEMNGGA